MCIRDSLTAAAVGLSRLRVALDGVASGARSAAGSLRALDTVGQRFATAFDLAGPGSQNLIEAEIMRRLFTRIGTQAVTTVFGLTGPGSQNLIEAEIERRQHTRVGAERNLVGTMTAEEAALFIRCVTV